MFRRKILEHMMSWKKSTLSEKKALVIKGLRQIGKTFTALEYARSMYENVIYINFKDDDTMKSVFEGDLIVDRIIMDISARMPDVSIVPNKTIFVFDEVQECSNARASIKPFMLDGRFDVICTGSLLGIKGYNKKNGKGIPTGFEHTIYMKPMDFEEFLWAKGIDEKVIDQIKDCFKDRKPVSPAIHSSMIRYFKEYICVGGLPHIVDVFLKTHDMNAVRSEQLDILDEYRDDFGKHLDENESEYTDKVLLARINSVFDSIPVQLSKENKKFQYSMLRKNARGNEYAAAIQWLTDSGLVVKCHNLSLLQLPLEGNKEEDTFKLYVQDTGLFIAMLKPGSAGDILSGDMGIYKGAVYENIIADTFSKMGCKLYYYRRDSGMEIDFVMRMDGKPVLIEVKSKTGKTKSALQILSHPETYGVDECFRLNESNVGRNGNITTIPQYMAFLLTGDAE